MTKCTEWVLLFIIKLNRHSLYVPHTLLQLILKIKHFPQFCFYFSNNPEPNSSIKVIKKEKKRKKNNNNKYNGGEGMKHHQASSKHPSYQGGVGWGGIEMLKVSMQDLHTDGSHSSSVSQSSPVPPRTLQECEASATRSGGCKIMDQIGKRCN